MTDKQESELEVLGALLKHAKMLRSSRPPQTAIAAAKWEMFFQEKLSELETRLMGNHELDAGERRTGTHD